ncbi:hypothetical protein EK904_007094 [Melospiza melodia maxima]|nr:hypothetical protein EK904_007094 [Melospiza melodia maxima]
MAACPTAHTLVLIWSNPKFQQLPPKIWHHINCHGRTACINYATGDTTVASMNIFYAI